MRAQAKPPSQKDWYMDPLVMTFSKKKLIHQVNYNRDPRFWLGPYFSYRATWGLFTKDITRVVWVETGLFYKSSELRFGVTLRGFVLQFF